MGVHSETGAGSPAVRPVSGERGAGSPAAGPRVGEGGAREDVPASARAAAQTGESGPSLSRW